ncbi:MAG: SMC-Scp complex subunit ScpB [Thermoguttaceae bacterium]|nr:SMC-Scp complex subunit ScpB [Thermoguttaceae bacterium]MDW8079283.1 SMC-Scp complex subunit ScpB [Thermoguttaceae bacterium]
MNTLANGGLEDKNHPDLPPESLGDATSSAEELARLYAETLLRETAAIESTGLEGEEVAGGIAPGYSPPVGEPPPEKIVEALLFVGDPSAPALAAERLIQLAGLTSVAELEAVVARLNARYEKEGRPYRVFKTPDGYVLRLLDQYRPYVARLRRRTRESRLSQAALEVLAVVAYRQPITAEEVSRLRGRPSGHLLTQLVQKGLVQAAPEPGRSRPLLFRTTRLFEELFGLESLEDLPHIKKDGPPEGPSPGGSPDSPRA